MKCIRSGEQLRLEDMASSSESLATRDYSASYSSRAAEADIKVENSNIEEAESTLRESGYLNYEEARALLGRLEFQKGNIEAALHVFEGIDITSVTSKIKVSLSRRCEQNRRRSQSDAVPPMSMHAISLLLEAIYLKVKSLQGLGRFEEAAQSCKVILDTIESALPEGIPESVSADWKLQDILNKAVELLPELWKLAGSLQEPILSYRRALLYNWNLNMETTAKIEKEFAVFLLYSGSDASPPNLRSQGNREHWPIRWKSCFQGSWKGEKDIAFLPSVTMERGILLSAQARSVASDSERISKQTEVLEVLESAETMMRERDPSIIFYLSLENAEQRKLDAALYHAKQLLKLEAGFNVRSYVLMARILSAQKRYVDAEDVINAALDQTGKWDQGELLRTKAKLQIAQGQLQNAIDTYIYLLAIVQVRTKSLCSGKKLPKNWRNSDRSLEMETWHDLANVYTSLSKWRDAEACLSKSKIISPYSASRWHSTGLLYEAKGLHQEALKAFRAALDVEPNHVPSLVSTACVLRRLGSQSIPIIRSFLTDAIRLDKTNHSAWYNLGLLYKADVSASALEAVECFEAAVFLEDSAPVESFRLQPDLEAHSAL
ncbi:hypothetical protein OIU78_007349 [Salix suchowensis]|nr:hypothetical protein OIU78_007349 [Salix suchowensis]